MRIHLFRHGIAIDRADPAAPADDADRPLTIDGRERTRLALGGMVALGLAVDRIVASPYLRCVQTAEIATQVLGVPRLAVETHAGLAPGADQGELLAGLRNLRDDSVMLIGHAPDLDLTLACLVGVAAPVTALKKAGLATLSLKAGAERARLVALFEPKVLRQLGGED